MNSRPNSARMNVTNCSTPRPRRNGRVMSCTLRIRLRILKKLLYEWAISPRCSRSSCSSATLPDTSPYSCVRLGSGDLAGGPRDQLVDDLRHGVEEDRRIGDERGKQA